MSDRKRTLRTDGAIPFEKLKPGTPIFFVWYPRVPYPQTRRFSERPRLFKTQVHHRSGKTVFLDLTADCPAQVPARYSHRAGARGLYTMHVDYRGDKIARIFALDPDDAWRRFEEDRLRRRTAQIAELDEDIRVATAERTKRKAKGASSK